MSSVASHRVRVDRGPIVCDRCVLATSAWLRTRGLLGRAGMESGEGLWIQPTNSIHMLFMRFAIDVVWASQDGRVLKLVQGLGPWKMSGCRGAKIALEVPTGTIQESGVRVGDHLIIER